LTFTNCVTSFHIICSREWKGPFKDRGNY